MDLSQKILQDPINKWIFRTCDTEIYLAGGFVRDMFLGRVSQDRDYAVRSGVEEFSRQAAKRFHGTFIPVKKWQTYRIVFENRGRGRKIYKAVLDFNILKSTIYNDLKKRDFTMNAIAWSPKTGILDPFDGRKDLKKYTVTAVRLKNLIEDPLRMLRAYRLAAENNFHIEGKTRKYIKNHSEKLLTVASERITEEFFKLLNVKSAYQYIKESFHDGMIESILFSKKHVDTETLKKIKANVKVIDDCDSLVKNVSLKRKRSMYDKKMEMMLDDEISQGLTRKGLIRLFLILKDISEEKGKLKMSSVLRKALKDMNRAYEILRDEKLPSGKSSLKKRLFQVFRCSDNRVFETAVVLSIFHRKKLQPLYSMCEEFIRIKNKKLLSGDEVKNILQIREGVKIGEILSKMKEKQMEGSIQTKAEARKWLRLNYT